MGERERKKKKNRSAKREMKGKTKDRVDGSWENWKRGTKRNDRDYQRTTLMKPSS